MQPLSYRESKVAKYLLSYDAHQLDRHVSAPVMKNKEFIFNTKSTRHTERLVYVREDRLDAEYDFVLFHRPLTLSPVSFQVPGMDPFDYAVHLDFTGDVYGFNVKNDRAHLTGHWKPQTAFMLVSFDYLFTPNGAHSSLLVGEIDERDETKIAVPTRPSLLSLLG